MAVRQVARCGGSRIDGRPFSGRDIYRVRVRIPGTYITPPPLSLSWIRACFSSSTATSTLPEKALMRNLFFLGLDQKQRWPGRWKTESEPFRATMYYVCELVQSYMKTYGVFCVYRTIMYEESLRAAVPMWGLSSWN